MAFYSDYSSEEDYDDGYEPWNPNELIDQIQRTQDEQAKSELKKQLLEYFLDQQRPMLTLKMKDFLLEDDVLESLLGFVNRLDKTKTDSTSNNNNNKKELTRRELNPEGQEDDVRKSYHVMELFQNPINDFDDIIDEKLTNLLTELFKVFEPNSNGNFYHFHKILGQFLVRAPIETTTVLLHHEFVWKMLEFLHETPVADALIEVFCCNFSKQNETIAYYKSLVEHKIYERIGEKIYGKNQPVSLFASEFFVRLLEKLSTHELAGILFVNLCRTSSFIDGLFGVIIAPEDSTEYSRDQRQGCANVIRELLIRSGEKSFEAHEFARPIPNMLSAVHERLHEHAKGYVAPLANNVLVGLDSRPQNSLEFSSYTVKKPLGVYIFTLTEILADLIVNNPETLNVLSPACWKVITNWFFENTHNNLYHVMFFKIFRTVLSVNHEESIRNLFKVKFVTTLINRYKSKDALPSKGFYILIANLIRLTADTQQSVEGNFKHYLTSHDGWKNFVPILREDTLVQLKRYSDMEMMDEVEDEEEDGIDLGSVYAHSLGFDQTTPAFVDASPKKKKKKNKKKKKKTAANGQTTDSSTTTATTTTASSGADHTTAVNKVSPQKAVVPTPPATVNDPVNQDENNNATPSEPPSWWKDLTADLEKSQPKEEGNTMDWWKDLKEELDNMA